MRPKAQSDSLRSIYSMVQANKPCVPQVYMRPYISGPSLKAVLHAFLVFTSERPLAALVMSHAVFGSAVLIFLLWLWGKRPVYLVDFYCFRPPNHLAGTIEDVIRGAEITEVSMPQNLKHGNCLHIAPVAHTGMRMHNAVLFTCY